MNYNLMPTLEHIALVNISAILWNKQDIRALIKKFSKSPLFSKLDPGLYIMASRGISSRRKLMWQKIQSTVEEMASQLTIPTLLKEKLIDYIQPVGFQILRWMEYHYRNYVLDLPKHFCWTPQGIIDKKKTVEILIEDETIHVGLRYKLACIYCCEDDIQKLWDKLPQSSREFYYDIENPCNVMQHELIVLWTYYSKGEFDRYDSMIRERINDRCSPYENAFQFAAVSGNKAATKYFLQKLTSKQCLVNTAIQVAKKRRECYKCITDTPQEYHTDVLCFLLSDMSFEQQIKVFKKCPCEVLQSLLDWPWQSYFVETATHLCDYLTGNSYHLLLSAIIHKVVRVYRDYNYQKMFGKFWQKTTDAHKRYLICNTIAGIIGDLTEIKDIGNIKLIFQDVSLVEKRNLIFSEIGRNICTNIIRNDEWDFLKYFIQLCISSKNDILQFKQLCLQQTNPPIIFGPFIGSTFKSVRDKKLKFYGLLDDIACYYDNGKRKKESDGHSSKKCCN